MNMSKPFKPPPLEDQILNTINPANWFSGLIVSNLKADFDYLLSARDHSKIEALPPITPIDVQESPGFGPAAISIDPRKYFKYGLANGVWGQVRNVLKLSLSSSDFDAYSDWTEGWKPKLTKGKAPIHGHGSDITLVQEVKGVTGTILEGWIDSGSASEDEKNSRLELYNKLEWWTKTSDIKPYRDMAWTNIMESAIEATYFTAKRQYEVDRTLTKAEFDKIESEFNRVVNKNDETSLRKKLDKAKNETGYIDPKTGDKKGRFSTGKSKLSDILDGKKKSAVNEAIRKDQNYNLELHQIFTSIVTEDRAKQLINLGRDTDGQRLLDNLRTLHKGESHFAWKDFLEKFDQGAAIRNMIWNSVTSADAIRIAEPIYAVLTGGKTMPPTMYKRLASITQVGQKFYPLNPALLMASALNYTGYFGLSSHNNLVKFHNFAYLEFKEGRFGAAGFGAKFTAKQFEGLLWSFSNKKDSLYGTIMGLKVKPTSKTGDYFETLSEFEIGAISQKLLNPDELLAYLTGLLDPSMSMKNRGDKIAELTKLIDKYKYSESLKTLQTLVTQGKLKDFDLLQFVGFADKKGLGTEFQGLVGRLSKYPAQLHSRLLTLSGKAWKLPVINKFYGAWSKYKLNNLFFNSKIPHLIEGWILKALGASVGGPLGVIVAYIVEDLIHKFTSNLWAMLTGGKTHAYIGDNTKKMFIIGCGCLIAPFALVIFIIVIVIGGAFAWLGGPVNTNDTTVANQDVVVIVKNIDSPISTITNSSTEEKTTYDITVKNNLDTAITILTASITEYSEEAYWQGSKTLTTFDTQLLNGIDISANAETNTSVTLPYFNAVKNAEEGRIIRLTINVSYIQKDKGAGGATGTGVLVLGKIKQPIGLPVELGGSNHITNCHGDIQKGSGRPHVGVDIGVPLGTPLRATLAGEVRVCNLYNNVEERTKDICSAYHIKYNIDEIESSAYGNFILVTDGQDYTTLYAHLRDLNFGPSTPPNIVDGVFVNVGDVIAYAGNTGNSTGPHVHYEVINGNFYGARVDPWNFVSGSTCKIN